MVFGVVCHTSNPQQHIHTNIQFAGGKYNLMLTDTKIKINLEEKYLLAVNQIVMPNAAAIIQTMIEWIEVDYNRHFILSIGTYIYLNEIDSKH